MDIVIGNSRDINLEVSYAVIALEVNPNPSIALEVNPNPSIALEVNPNPSMELVQLGTQGLTGPAGPVGPKGDPLAFEDLNEAQKLELRGDVGNTSTNYANVFYNSLLS